MYKDLARTQILNGLLTMVCILLDMVNRLKSTCLMHHLQSSHGLLFSSGTSQIVQEVWIH